MVRILTSTNTTVRERFLSNLNGTGSVAKYAGQIVEFDTKEEALEFFYKVADYVRQTGTEFVFYAMVHKGVAAAFLEKNIENRKINWAHVESLCEQMMSENGWKNTGDAICIALLPDGEIRVVNGQHRSLAIVACDDDKTYKFLVQVGGTTEDFAIAGDGGVPRTPGQRLGGLGYTTDRNDESAIRICARYPNRTGNIKGTGPKLKAWADKYLADVHKVRGWLAGLPKRFMRAPLLAAVVRAMPYVQEEKLKRFCALLADHTLSPEPGEEIIYKARVLVTEGFSKGSERARLLMYLRAQNAVHHFTNKTGISVLRSIDTDLYPIV